MNSRAIKTVLDQNRKLLAKALQSFEKSLAKCQSIPLVDPLSFEAEESFDSLTSKFARICDVFTQKVLKSIVHLMREDAPTFVDRMNLCEKLLLIPSAQVLISIRDLRNLIAHEYSEDQILEIYEETLALSRKLVLAIQQTEKSIDNLTFPRV
jgi:hypothetical protein